MSIGRPKAALHAVRPAPMCRHQLRECPLSTHCGHYAQKPKLPPVFRTSVVISAFALASCSSDPPRDCEVASKQALQCLERFRGKTDRELLLGCFPFSLPQRVAGAWVSGFETNEFYEGKKASPSLIHKAVGDTGLQFQMMENHGPSIRVYQIEFVGRRSQCEMGFPHHTIVVDRVISQAEAEAEAP